MELIYARVCAWNCLRYTREFNAELYQQLIAEELAEWRAEVAACELSKAIHELCDVVYVAFGGLWKLGIEFSSLQVLVDTVASSIEADEAATLDSAASMIEVTVPATNAEQHIVRTVLLVLSELLSYGLTEQDIEECLLAVCDSNDSKSIKKTASNIKANSNDKGVYYVSPIVAITQIVETANERTRYT